MSSLRIRKATAADIPAITAIYGDAVRHGTASFELEPPSEAEMRRRQEALLQGGFPYLAAQADGRLLGYAYAGPYRSRPGYRFSVEDSIYLDRQSQGRGIGRRLLTALLAEAEARGFRQMVAVIGDSAHASSIALHRALGFRRVGTLRCIGYKFDRWLDSVLMQRPLGAGDATPPHGVCERSGNRFA
jgi:phosphinothricin acetyltransferase